MLWLPRMQAADTPEMDRTSPFAAAELALLQRRSDARGLLRLAGHLLAIAVAAFVHALALEQDDSLAIKALSSLALGFTLVTMFAAMHECVHRTAFKSQWLNDGVGFFAGLLSFYNSTFYRPYHGWHHRFTQLAGKDPELEDPKPRSFLSYLLEMSGLPWWLGKLKTHFTLAFGKTASYRFLNEKTGPEVVRSVRLQLSVYAAAIALSFVLGRPYFVTFWLVPMLVAQPLLRAILLAEHTGCSENDDALSNTRTTHTLWPVRFLMWQMPYHAEHHRYPALPFFALARAHERLGPLLSHVARHGYLGVHASFLRSLTKDAASERAA